MSESDFQPGISGDAGSRRLRRQTIYEPIEVFVFR